MKALPRPLRPWAEPLAMLSTEVQSGLGPWLAALRNLFGPLSPPRRAAEGEPDGYDGIARRGSYDRLLLSEWAVALELPDEFTRRAVMGEHVFTRPAFRQSRGSGSSIALLDAGPDQLGAPRLAHLAALVVLQARAQAAGATFHFRTLQDPGPPRALDRTSLHWWAGHPTWSSPLSFVDAWQEQLSEHGDAERWLIGGPALQPMAEALGASLLLVEPEPNVLRVTAVPRGRRRTAATLPLPASDVGVRVLRSPLRSDSQGFTRAPMPDAIGTVSANGRRLFLQESEGFRGYGIPRSAAARTGRPKWTGPGPVATLLGVDDRRRMVGIGRSFHGKLVLLGSGLRGRTSMGETLELPFEVPHGLADATRVRFMVATARRNLFEGWILDSLDQLWRLRVAVDVDDRILDESELVCLERSCGYLVRASRDHLVWHSRSRGAIVATTTRHQLDDAEPETAVVGVSSNSDGSSPLYGAWRQANHYVLMPPPPASGTSVRAPDGDVFGLSLVANQAEGPSLLFTCNDREVWSRCGIHDAYEDHLHFSTASPLLEVRHEPNFEYVVWRTKSELGLFALQDENMRLRLRLSKGGR